LSTLKATVLVPTHSHAETLGLAVASALGQTVQDLEVLIVEDGPTLEVDGAALQLAAADRRIRRFCFEKGERHGEASRHQVLSTEARGAAVFYLSDDDLWLPDHVETLLPLLQEGCLAHTHPTFIRQDGSVETCPGSAEAMLKNRNHVPLSAMAHTMEAYRRLPVGWSPAPKGEPYSDLFMWKKFLTAGFELKSSKIPTVVHFPSSYRGDWSMGRRVSEMERWASLISKDSELARKALLGEA
jgi:glycosyltransferase involved in cell wall biosynthesis